MVDMQTRLDGYHGSFVLGLKCHPEGMASLEVAEPAELPEERPTSATQQKQTGAPVLHFLDPPHQQSLEKRQTKTHARVRG